MREHTIINTMTAGKVSRQLVLFSLPIVLANVLQMLYTVIDMVIIGRFVGNVGLSGVATGGDILTFVLMLCVGFTSGGQVIISQYVGYGDKNSISHTVGTMFTFVLGTSLVLSVICIIFNDTFLSWMNCPEEAFSAARSYSLTCFFGLFFIFGYNLVSAILRGMGDGRHPLIFVGVAAVVHVILVYIFVPILRWDAFGTALATVIGQAVSFIASVVYLYKKREAFGFDFKLSSFKIDGGILKKLLKLGLPLALQNAAITISMLVVNSLVNSCGLIYSAVGAVGNKLTSVMSIVSSAVGTAGSSMVGQNMGAGKHDRVRSVVMVSLFINIVTLVVVAGIYLLFPEQIFSFFGAQGEVLNMARQYMVITAVMFLGISFMGPFNEVVNGTGFAMLGFVIGIMDGIVARIGLALLLGNVFELSVIGYWYGNALAGFVTAGIGGAYYFSGRWKTRKLLVDEK